MLRFLYDVLFGRLQYCDVLGHLFLLGGELVYAIPHNREIAYHLVDRGHGERGSAPRQTRRRL
jgi:hypothetical protein